MLGIDSLGLSFNGSPHPANVQYEDDEDDKDDATRCALKALLFQIKLLTSLLLSYYYHPTDILVFKSALHTFAYS